MLRCAGVALRDDAEPSPAGAAPGQLQSAAVANGGVDDAYAALADWEDESGAGRRRRGFFQALDRVLRPALVVAAGCAEGDVEVGAESGVVRGGGGGDDFGEGREMGKQRLRRASSSASSQISTRRHRSSVNSNISVGGMYAVSSPSQTRSDDVASL